mmetsp:Transcript_40050/g.35710  ORF Transcript_40050/g.35710 Transcript_40050/m.35710 type:complete len:80 (+) Transcript_40050:288-527(+)
MPPIEKYIPHREYELSVTNPYSPRSELESNSAVKMNNNSLLNNTDFQAVNTYNNELTELKPELPYYEVLEKQKNQDSEA